MFRDTFSTSAATFEEVVCSKSALAMLGSSRGPRTTTSTLQIPNNRNACKEAAFHSSNLSPAVALSSISCLMPLL